MVLITPHYGDNSFSVFRSLVILVNAGAILLYAPNYLSFNLPFIKLLLLAIPLANVFFIFISPGRVSSFFLTFVFIFCFGVLVTAAHSFIFRDNYQALVFSASFVFKALHFVSLSFVIRSKDQVIYFVKSLVFFLSILGLHTSLQFILYTLNIIRPEDTAVKTQGYTFYTLGLWGWFRVSSSYLGFDFIRAQSYFQEPGYLAFYLVYGLFLAVLVKDSLKKWCYKFVVFIFSISIAFTFSLTGLISLSLFILLCVRNKGHIILLSSLFLPVIIFVLFNDSEYISKLGSIKMRVDDLLSSLSIFLDYENIIFGIGYGAEDIMLSGARVNNFIIELVFYSGVFGAFVFIFYFLHLYFFSQYKIKFLLFIVFFYSLSTPMVWSPLILCAALISEKYKAYDKVS